ncbi:hypothetical protein OG440_37495 [Streptomyces sp. NBC_00637]|uniref:hypothetical protein n=1 Tax=Streptomyces sp. NBC_00637 TaxID=2903667 RepID=UPI00324DAB07
MPQPSPAPSAEGRWEHKILDHAVSLRDDALFLAGRWQAADAPVQLGVAAGAVHGFTLSAPTVTEREQRRERDFPVHRATAASPA